MVSVATASSRVATALAGCLIVGLAAAPALGDRQLLHLLGEIYTYLCLATLWNLLAGYAGLVSVGQQAYVGIGGYLLFAMTIVFHVPPLLAIPLAGIIAAAIAVPAAALLFRLRGAYFAIGSWVLAEIMRLGVAQISSLGGGSGTSLPAGIVTGIAATRQAREFTLYWIALALALLTLGGTYAVLRSRFGLALRAVGGNEEAARSTGVGVLGLKLTVYVGVAFATAMTGAVIFLQKLRISPDAAFNVNDWTAFVIFMAVIGGIGTLEGPVIGTLLFFLLRQWLADFGSLYLLLLGLVAIGIMVAAPRGLWGLVADRYDLHLAPVRKRLHVDAAAADGHGLGRRR